MSFLLQQPGWVTAALTLLLGVSMIVGFAAGGVRLTRSAAWQRTFWQVSILGILALLAGETTGMSAGVVRWLRAGGALPSFASGARRQPERTLTGQDVRRPAGPVTAGGVAWFRDEDVAVRNSKGERPSAPSKRTQHEPPVPAAGRDLHGGLSDSGSNPANKEDRSPPSQARPLVGSERAVASAMRSRLDAHVGASAAAERSSLGDAMRWVRNEVVGGASAELARPPSAVGAAYGLALVWNGGAVVLLLRMAWARWLLLRFRRKRAPCMNCTLQGRTDTLAPRLGVRRRVSVFEASGLATPIAFGCLRPTIVVPATFLEDFDASQRDAMLTHELAHLAAGDPAWQMMADFTAAVLWWHPLVWWLRRQWRLAGEMAADEACLLGSQKADALADCLVLLARRLDCRQQLAGMAIAEPGFRSVLGKRVERLLAPPVPAWPRPSRARTMLFTGTAPVVLFLVGVSGTAWARAQVPLAEGVTTMRVFVDSWRQSLAAAALAAILAPATGDSAQTFAAEARQPNPAMVREGEGEKPAAREATKEQTPAARKQREEIAAQSREERKELEPRKPQARREQRREAREEPREKAAEAAKPQPEGERSDATLRQMMERRRQLEKEAMEIRRRLEALKPDREALERIEAQLSQLQRPGAPMPGGPVLDRERRAQAEAQLADLAAAIKRAREADKPEEVERIEQQYRDLARQLLRRPSDAGFPGRPFDVLRRPPGGMPGGAIQNWPTFEGGDIERRLQHVRTAVENLRAAGLHDQAEAVAREAERLIREQPTPPMPGAPLGPPPGPPAAKDAFPGAGPPPPAQHLERAVDELREQMQQMQRQMEEIRRDLRAIAERSQKDK